jgi:undecaprenyl diphosphate synthase
LFTSNSAVISGIMDKTSGIPVHVAFIMDGNGRWAERRGLPRLEGHQSGVKNVRPIIEYLNKKGIRYVTLYAFSTENWNRPDDEIDGLFKILESVISEEARELHKNNAMIRHIGRLTGISQKLKKSITDAVKLTENNSGINVGFAFNYGGRSEILDAVRKIIDRRIKVGDLTEENFRRYLYTNDCPDVDLVIRTGGEIRTSNFLIWQAAYSEYYFTPVLWPDFNEQELEKALRTYSQRQRRFGGLQ